MRVHLEKNVFKKALSAATKAEMGTIAQARKKAAVGESPSHPG